MPIESESFPATSIDIDRVEDITHRLLALENDTTLLLDENYGGRADALEALEFGVLDAIAGLRETAGGPLLPPGGVGIVDGRLQSLADRATALTRRLEDIDRRLLDDLRDRIRGGLRGAAVREVLENQTVGRHRLGHSPGYEALDAFLNDLLLPVQAPSAALDREPEMVFYQPTPARIILEFVDRADFMPNDVFWDMGSGLGLVSMLVNIISGVRAIGVEIDPSYQQYATARAADLGLTNVDFVNCDARLADFREGTVFFLYTPFTGQIMQDVLDRIEQQRGGRPIRLFSYGPCTQAVASQGWLRPVGRVDDDHSLAMFVAG